MGFGYEMLGNRHINLTLPYHPVFFIQSADICPCSCGWQHQTCLDLGIVNTGCRDNGSTLNTKTRYSLFKKPDIIKKN